MTLGHIRYVGIPAAAMILLCAPGLSAAGDNPWIGVKVIKKAPGPLQVGNDVKDDDDDYRVYVVRHVQSDWLWVESTPRGPSGWIRSGAVVRLDRALDFLSQEVGTRPTAWSYGMRGRLRLERNEIDLAISDFDASLRLNPADSKTFFYRASAFKEKENPQRAFSDLAESIRRNPGNKNALAAMGTLLFVSGKNEEALECLNSALKIDPKDVRVHVQRAMVRMAQDEIPLAMADCEMALRLDPKYAEAYNTRALCRMAAIEREEAILDDLNEAIRFAPSLSIYHVSRAAFRDMTNHPDLAISDLLEAVRIDPKGSRAYRELAWRWSTNLDAKYRDGKRAVEFATRACELGKWKDPLAIASLGAAYAELGDFDSALKWETKAKPLYQAEDDRRRGEKRLALYRDHKPYRYPLPDEVATENNAPSDERVERSASPGPRP